MEYKNKKFNNINEALKFARRAAYLLDIKIIETLRKIEWMMWGDELCFFQYDITAGNHKNDDSTFVRIQSTLLCKSLHGKDVQQIETTNFSPNATR